MTAEAWTWRTSRTPSRSATAPARPDETRVEISICLHCGLPAPAGDAFCCNGCRTIHGAIADAGLGRFHALRAPSGRPGVASDRSFADLDDADFQALHCRTRDDGRRTIDLYLDGVHCSACVWLAERAVPHAEIRLDITTSVAELTFDPVQAPLSRLARRLADVGLLPHPLAGDARDRRRVEERRLLSRIGVAWALSGNAMVFALAMYVGEFTDMDPSDRALFRHASLFVATPSLLWCGWPFLHGAWTSLRTRALSMDVPIALGLCAGFASGAWNTWTGRGELWFDSVASLVFLLLVGRWLTLRQKRLAADAASLLLALAPRTARRIEADGVREVPLEALQRGDQVELRAGDSVPADGVVAAGRSTVDRAILTGESLPEAVGPGDSLHAGMVNLADRLQMRVDQTGAATRVGRLLQAVQEAARRRAPVQLLVDRLLGRFVVAVLLLAGLTAALWTWLDPARAIENMVALLVVTCPCALGLATPLAVQVALGRAAQRGLFVKGGDVLERFAVPQQGRAPLAVWLDKTGTVTAGRFTLQRWLGDDAVQPWVRALEATSSHPLARALVEALPGGPVVASEIVSTVGGGIEGRVDGATVLVGSPGFVRARAIGRVGFESALAAEGWTPVLVAVDGVVVAAAGLGDAARPDAAASVQALRDLGFQVGLLSGDHPDVVRRVGAALGIATGRCLGACTPEAKLAHIQAEARRGPVVMVGDGVNDAAALAAATVGIAVHGGAEAALQAADAFLTRPGLQGVVALAHGSRRTVASIRRNLWFSLAYNTLGAGLAVAGLLHPLLAALLMPLSSLTLVAHSTRQDAFREAP